MWQTFAQQAGQAKASKSFEDVEVEGKNYECTHQRHSLLLRVSQKDACFLVFYSQYLTSHFNSLSSLSSSGFFSSKQAFILPVLSLSTVSPPLDVLLQRRCREKEAESNLSNEIATFESKFLMLPATDRRPFGHASERGPQGWLHIPQVL